MRDCRCSSGLAPRRSASFRFHHERPRADTNARDASASSSLGSWARASSSRVCLAGGPRRQTSIWHLLGSGWISSTSWLGPVQRPDLPLLRFSRGVQQDRAAVAPAGQHQGEPRDRGRVHFLRFGRSGTLQFTLRCDRCLSSARQRRATGRQDQYGRIRDGLAWRAQRSWAGSEPAEHRARSGRELERCGGERSCGSVRRVSWLDTPSCVWKDPGLAERPLLPAVPSGATRADPSGCPLAIQARSASSRPMVFYRDTAWSPMPAVSIPSGCWPRQSRMSEVSFVGAVKSQLHP